MPEREEMYERAGTEDRVSEVYEAKESYAHAPVFVRSLSGFLVTYLKLHLYG
jgi:hypothetical protein